jgi:hypothetical protein
MADFQFGLSSPLKVPAGGQMLDGQLLVLRAPTNKHRAQALKLDEMFSIAQKEEADTSKPAKESKGDAQAPSIDDLAQWILSLFRKSEKVSFTEAFDEFRKLMTTDTLCQIEGEYKMTTALFDEISIEDGTKLFGLYMANFIIASVYRELVAS